jgi:hypothetical protein
MNDDILTQAQYTVDHPDVMHTGAQYRAIIQGLLDMLKPEPLIVKGALTGIVDQQIGKSVSDEETYWRGRRLTCQDPIAPV